MLAGLLATTAAAQSSRVTTPLVRAWDDWRTASAAAPSAAQRAAVTEGRLEAQLQELRVGEERDKGAKAGFEHVGTAAEWISKGFGALADPADTLDALEHLATGTGSPQGAAGVQAVRDVLERAGVLDPADRTYEPRAAPDGQPRVPSACEGNPSCKACYLAAQEKLTDSRLRLEKLRTLYAATYKDAKAQIAFADGASAVHGISAMAWQKHKMGVTKALKGLDQAYENKYPELLASLLAALREVEKCEEELMKVPNWYDRYGFIYYEFMKSAYKKPTL